MAKQVVIKRKKMKKYSFLIPIMVLLLVGCSARKEKIMPFVNIFYNGSRIFPIKNSETNLAFRAWINNSTSLDRVITVYADTLIGNNGNLVELGYLYTRGIFGKKEKSIYTSKEIIPKSGFDLFWKKIDSLNIMEFKDQKDDFPIALHQPLSLFVIEVKNSKRYNSFTFKTYFPDTLKTNTAFDQIQDLIFEEFEFEFRVN